MGVFIAASANVLSFIAVVGNVLELYNQRKELDRSFHSSFSQCVIFHSSCRQCVRAIQSEEGIGLEFA